MVVMVVVSSAPADGTAINESNATAAVRSLMDDLLSWIRNGAQASPGRRRIEQAQGDEGTLVIRDGSPCD